MQALIFRSFDTDLPLIYDDEDLDEFDLKSPSQSDRPTQMSSFVCTIKLSQILAFALRTVVSHQSGRALPPRANDVHSTRQKGPELSSATSGNGGSEMLSLLLSQR